MTIQKKFWQNKRVFVTGHTGFKGGWLSLWLYLLGAKVAGLSLQPSSRPNFFEAVGLSDLLESRIGDIRNIDEVTDAMSVFQPEILFHLAAQPLVRASYEDPIGTYATNVMGTANVLEVARKMPSLKVIVVITSDKCYQNNEWVWKYREMDRLGGHDPYSNSKACAELVVDAYRKSFLSQAGVQVATVRAGNVIGGGDWSCDRLIPDYVRASTTGKPLLVRNADAIRPWQHVLEPLGGYLILASRLFETPNSFSGAWNFGPLDPSYVSVKDVLEVMGRFWESGVDCQLEPSMLHEAQILKVDSTKATSMLNWKPVLDFSTVIQWTAEWYKAFYADETMYDYTVNQIETFERMILS